MTGLTTADQRATDTGPDGTIRPPSPREPDPSNASSRTAPVACVEGRGCVDRSHG